MENLRKQRLNGKLTTENLEKVEGNIQEEINNTDKLEVSLSNVEKVDMADFNTLVSAHKLAKRASKDLTYINCQSIMLQHMLSQSNFDHVFIDHKKDKK